MKDPTSGKGLNATTRRKEFIRVKGLVRDKIASIEALRKKVAQDERDAKKAEKLKADEEKRRVTANEKKRLEAVREKKKEDALALRMEAEQRHASTSGEGSTSEGVQTRRRRPIVSPAASSSGSGSDAHRPSPRKRPAPEFTGLPPPTKKPRAEKRSDNELLNEAITAMKNLTAEVQVAMKQFDAAQAVI